ncbi:unnamed protein product, partial [Rotaria sp. Silwood1]
TRKPMIGPNAGTRNLIGA